MLSATSYCTCEWSDPEHPVILPDVVWADVGGWSVVVVLGFIPEHKQVRSSEVCFENKALATLHVFK